MGDSTLIGKMAEDDLSASLISRLELTHRGKVRNTYQLPDRPGKRLLVATDRVSIFDFPLGFTIPHKGEVLTALTIFWLNFLFDDPSGHHMVAYGKEIDQYLPVQLTHYFALQAQGLIVNNLEMHSAECIARGYLTGSGWQSYKESQSVCGHQLPAGLNDGSKLPEALFTPSDKALVGHDEHWPVKDFNRRFGSGQQEATLDLFARACEYALTRDLIIADTKFEFGQLNGELILADEVLTPDSSRYWDVAAYAEAQKSKKAPVGYDKQYLREAGKKAIIDGREYDISDKKQCDPTNEDHRRLVLSWRPPVEVIEKTSRLYQDLVIRLSDRSLGHFHKEVMGI